MGRRGEGTDLPSRASWKELELDAAFLTMELRERAKRGERWTTRRPPRLGNNGDTRKSSNSPARVCITLTLISNVGGGARRGLKSAPRGLQIGFTGWGEVVDTNKAAASASVAL
ncbi:hypothetical protein E2562_015351 [Oryza meyeriana var. granulata]|uniref:Uncharacterized protein n=1 Tax=Oryza meyeriana var. granulata TaxID=110450 RepID=A0A6G1EJP5_9ORYZ|nr:hypothetical protein E2562_015351 [Oryza meyeriana var. granulata]